MQIITANCPLAWANMSTAPNQIQTEWIKNSSKGSNRYIKALNRSTWSQIFSVSDQVLHGFHNLCDSQVLQDALTHTDNFTHLKKTKYQWYKRKRHLFTWMHLAKAFKKSKEILSALKLYILYIYLFPGNQAHDLCVATTMLYLWELMFYFAGRCRKQANPQHTA